MQKRRLALALTVLASLSTAMAGENQTGAHAANTLKVYILAGQSNMQGQARVRTIERLNLTEDSRPMYQDMNVKNGLPSAVENAYGVYFTAGDMKFGKSRALEVQKGPFQPGYGDQLTPDTTMGPDYTFGLYMRKHVTGPILIIKTAWGGRDLLQQFRPPSAGAYEKEKDRHGNPSGYYYGAIVKLVKEVLADPGKYHPGYNKADGYEIAGFFWFQGFNDAIGGQKNISQYGRLLACFIRDIRKDLEAPKMPFVIGVMGIDGVRENDPFRKAQAEPAALPEFQGNVAAVQTGQFWDPELVRIQGKVDDAAKKKVLADNPKLGGKALSAAVDKAAKSMASEVLTPEELKIMKTGTSNAGYHYLGSAYIYGMIGKACAEAMAEMSKGTTKP